MKTFRSAQLAIGIAALFGETCLAADPGRYQLEQRSHGSR